MAPGHGPETDGPVERILPTRPLHRDKTRQTGNAKGLRWETSAKLGRMKADLTERGRERARTGGRPKQPDGSRR